MKKLLLLIFFTPMFASSQDIILARRDTLINKGPYIINYKISFATRPLRLSFKKISGTINGSVSLQLFIDNHYVDIEKIQLYNVKRQDYFLKTATFDRIVFTGGDWAQLI